MDARVWKISTFVLGVLALLGIFFVTLFGVRLAGLNQIKAKELEASLSNKEEEMKANFQLEKETSTIKYVAEDVHGKFTFAYPKIWSTNVRRSDSDPELLFLADPKLIVMRSDEGPLSGLRVVVSKEGYTDKLRSIESDIESKDIKMKEEDVTLSGLKGKKFTGSTEESGTRKFSYVLLPLRDKTLYIGTDDLSLYAKQYDAILKSFEINQ